MKKILNRIASFFGYVPYSEETELMVVKNIELTNENGRLKEKIKQQNRFKDIVDIFAKNPTPVGDGEVTQEERKNYVGRVASFHEEILKPRLEFAKKLIGDMMFDEETPNDMIEPLRVGLYCCQEIIEWGESCKKEDFANINKEK